MRSLAEIMTELQARNDCLFGPGSELPTIGAGLVLPADLREFYSRFSEARLFGEKDDPRYRILPPGEFVQIGEAIYGQETSHPFQRSWYALAHVRDGNYIAIDCHPDRAGYCYDAFHETVDQLDYCGVIALSFTELMNRAAEAGDEAWWLGDRFRLYGNADAIARQA